MAVRVARKGTGEVVSGKFAIVEKENVLLYTGSTSDGKGGLRGCGKKIVFAAEGVDVAADAPDREIKRR